MQLGDSESIMKPVERRDRIVFLVSNHGRVSVEFLADQLSTSRETVRRDLSALAEAGRIRKFHGGATAITGESEPAVEAHFHARMGESIAEKRLIATRAAALFKDHDVLFIDSGSTTVFFAEALVSHRSLTVITNSILIAQTVARGDASNTVFLLGGQYHEDLVENLGPMVVSQIAQFHARHLVLTIGSANAAGIFDFNIHEAEIARAMIERAEMVTVLADVSKFERSGIFKVCDLSRIDRIVLDKAPDPSLAFALNSAGVEVIVANS